MRKEHHSYILPCLTGENVKCVHLRALLVFAPCALLPNPTPTVYYLFSFLRESVFVGCFMVKDAKESRDVLKVIEDLRRELRLEIRSLKVSVKHCSDTNDDIKELSNDVKALRKEMPEVMKLNRDLRKKNDKLKQKMEELEQCQRTNDMKTKGVPLESLESC